MRPDVLNDNGHLISSRVSSGSNIVLNNDGPVPSKQSGHKDSINIHCGFIGCSSNQNPKY